MTKSLKKIREFIGWKQKDLALRLGCTAQTISNLEDDRKKIKMSFIQCIAIRSVFNMEVEELEKRSKETKDLEEALELSAKSEQLRKILTILLDTPENEVSKEDMETIQFLNAGSYWDKDALDAGIDAASEYRKTEILSVLMDEKKRLFPKKRKTFDL